MEKDNKLNEGVTNITMSAGSAFKIGFFGALGASFVSLIFGLILFILFSIFGAAIITSITTEISNKTKIENIAPTLSVPSFIQNLFTK